MLGKAGILVASLDGVVSSTAPGEVFGNCCDVPTAPDPRCKEEEVADHI